jgi:type IV secretory pathway TraG/TraD family ATPase VirD4
MTGFAEWPPAAKALGLLFGAMLLAAVWLLLASTVFLVGTNMMGNREGIPFLEWWSYFRWYGFANPRVGSWLKIAAGVATAIPALLILARVARDGMSASGNKSLHGSTRWASRSEMKRAGFYAPFAGLYVGKDSRGKHLRFGGPEHVACYAPTRSGKGVGLVIPNCLLYEASLVCLDVKKENWAATAGIREAAGQKVFLFDPLAPDGRTARYNPFTYVRRDTIDAFEDIQRIAQMVFPHVSGDQAFWQDSARSAFVGAAGFLAATEASDFDLRELRSNLHAIYVGVTPDNIARLRPLLALFFQQLVDLQVRTLPQHDPNARHQVLLVLDEFPLLGPMPVLAEAFAFVAGFGIRMMLIMQSKAQLRDRNLYGPDKAEARGMTG